MAFNNFTSNQGTQTPLLTDNTGGVSGTLVPVYKLSMDASGTALTTNLFQGTILQVNTLGTLPNLPGGSVIVTAGTVVQSGAWNVTGTLAGGTIQAATVSSLPNIPGGTINAGTFKADARTTQNVITFGTQIALSAGTQGTVIGSASVGAGTSLWLQDLSIINPQGTVLCILSFGTAQQGTNVLFRGVLGTQTTPGIEKSYAKAVNAGMTNQDLVFSTGAAGTVDLSISYFIST